MRTTEFHAIADISPDPILLVSAEGVIEASNRAFAEHIGATADSNIEGMRLHELTVEPISLVAEFLHTCLSHEVAVHGSMRLRAGTDTRTYRVRGCTYPASPTRVLLHLQAESPLAVTPHQNVDHALREKQTLEVTLASIGDAVIVTDAAGHVTFLNAVAEKLTGFPADAAVGKPLVEIFRIVNERTRRVVENPVAKVLQTGAIVGLANHTVLLASDGKEIPIDDSAAPIRMPDGDLFGVVLIFRDITEQRRAELERAWLAAIVASSDDAIISKRLDGSITSWNSGAERMYGYRAEEIVGKPITTIIPAELHPEELQILQRLRHGERIDHFETVRLAKDGRRIEVSLTVSPIRDEEGEIVGASKVARDITERKRAERLLREVDQRKDEFLATLAHELRNPLAPIRTATEILRRTLPSGSQPFNAYTIIDRQVRQLVRLVDDLLDISRVTTDRIQLQKEKLDLGILLKAAVDSMRPAFEGARQVLTLALPGEAVFVEADSTRLMQVFSNILQNANKYTPPGGHTRVELRREDSEALVSVSDSGVGIPASMLEHVFDLFTQVDRSYDRTGGGLGIGLTLAKRLVEMHGGRIEARSEGPNRGSEFIVWLPLIRGPFVQSTATERVRSETLVPRRVLIADDNEDAAKSLSTLLEMMGHEARVAYDGLAAVEAAEHFRPEIVLLDIGMPKLDGYGAARRIAARPWASATLLVALTGWGQAADRQRAREAGFHHHLVKPVEQDVLSALLARNSPQ